MIFLNKLKLVWEIVRETIVKFYEGNMLNYCASIAFFTIFSFPGVFIVVILISGIFFNEDTVRQQLFLQLKELVGPESARDIKQIILNISNIEHTLFATLFGIGTIIFGATSVFISIQDGLNVAWELRPKPKTFALKFIINRLVSFAMVLTIGFIMLVTLLVDSMLVLFQDFLIHQLASEAFDLLEVANKVFSSLIIAVIFLLIYRFLPSGKVSLKYLLPGAVFSTGLFMLGKYLIGIYLGNSSLGTAYGAAGSLVVLLIWVFYSAIVLLLGAQLIEVVVKRYGGSILPDEQTVKIVTREV